MRCIFSLAITLADQLYMNRIQLIVLFLFGLSNHTWAQKIIEIESAKQAVDTLFFVDKEKGLEVSEHYLPIAQSIQDTFYITYFLDQAGELNRFLGHLRKAESQLLTCLEYKKDWEDLQDLSITYNNLGKTYKMMGEYELALNNFLKAYSLMEVSDNLLGQGYYLNNIGTLFDDQQNYPKAIEYYNRSYEVKKITGDSAGMASTSYNVGISYFNMSQWDQALDYFYRSYRSTSYQTLPNKRIRALTSIGRTLIRKAEYTDANQLLLSALPFLEKTDDQVLTPRLYLALSESYRGIENFDSANYFNELGFTNAVDKNNPKLMQDLYVDRSENFYGLEEYKRAFDALEQANSYNDSLLSEASIKAFTDVESKYNSERNLRLRKEAEIEVFKQKEVVQEKQQQLLWLLVLALFLTIVFIFLLLKYRAKRRSESLVLGQKMLIEKRNIELSKMNKRLEEELQDMHISIEEKSVILNNVFSKSHQSNLPPELLKLSPREMEVLANLALGLTNDQLAEKLFVSKTTIKTHLQRIYSKLLVRNRAQAVAIAHKYNIIGEHSVEELS